MIGASPLHGGEIPITSRRGASCPYSGNPGYHHRAVLGGEPCCPDTDGISMGTNVGTNHSGAVRQTVPRDHPSVDAFAQVSSHRGGRGWRERCAYGSGARVRNVRPSRAVQVIVPVRMSKWTDQPSSVFSL